MAEDYWNECYDRTARQAMSPDKFAAEFCSHCRNPDCERTGFRQDNPWFFRILSQKERLLDNPIFADPRDPTFEDIRESLDFQNMVRQALKLQISDDRGDWSIPSDAEVDRFVQQAGLLDPKPADDLIDEITKSPAPDDPVSTTPQAAPQPDVSLASPTPTTSPCHFVGEEKQAAPQPVKKAPAQVAPPTPKPRNPNVKVGPERLTPNTPTSLNTAMPSGGIMLGGVENQAPPPTPHDPWALPADSKKDDKVIEVGGKFVIGGKKEEK